MDALIQRQRIGVVWNECGGLVAACYSLRLTVRCLFGSYYGGITEKAGGITPDFSSEPPTDEET